MTEINPKDDTSYCRLGYSYNEVGNYDAAITAYQNELRLDPKDYVGYYSLGLMYKKLERYDEAIESFKNSINLNVNDDDVHEQLAVSYGCKFVELEFVELVMNNDPNSNLFKVVYDDAVKFYTSLVNKYEENPTIYYWIGYYR